jgi:hypothetical protein
VVKVAQDDQQSAVLGSEHVLRGNLDIVECDESCASRGGVGCLDCLCLDALATGDEEHSQATISLASDGKVAIWKNISGMLGNEMEGEHTRRR